VTLVDGVAMRFESPFDEQLDDYVSEFYVWPVTDKELTEAGEVWRTWAAWRVRFDAGEAPTPFEETEGARRLQTWRQEPPSTARRAVPEWRLDCLRSFTGRSPQHRVRWRFVDQA